MPFVISRLPFSRHFFINNVSMKNPFNMVICGLALLVTAGRMAAQDVRHVLTPVPGMTRAELVVVAHTNPVGVLVLSPGCNGDGASLVTHADWRRFAEEKHLMLIGVSFASEIDAIHDGSGYYTASKGSGKLLLDAIDGLTEKPLPLLLYGFSGGAHFTARFTEWKPERVAAWCAYSAGWWDVPQAARVTPPGMVVCGEEDGRLGASLFYFKQGRAIGRPWLWVGVPKNGHTPDSRVETFVRDYFAVVFDGRLTPWALKGGWVDIEEKTIAGENLSRYHPTALGWLPDMRLFATWKALMKNP